MIIGLDIGYSHVKAVNEKTQKRFPSAVGTWEEERFSLASIVEREASSSAQQERLVLTVDDITWTVGEEAITHSRFLARREDREWITSEEYRVLYLAAMSQMTTASGPTLQIVTGLPVSYFGDQDKLQEHLLGEHQAQRMGRRRQTFKVDTVHVVPQPLGSLLSLVLDNEGEMVDAELANSKVGVIDIGGKSTGFLSVHRLREVYKETSAIPIGCWEPIRVIAGKLNDRFPGLNLSSHEVIDAAVRGTVSYFGEYHDITELVQDALEPLISVVISQTTQVWNSGAHLDVVLVSGGGAKLVGDAICQHFPHATMVDEPIFANAQGFYRFGRRLWQQ